MIDIHPQFLPQWPRRKLRRDRPPMSTLTDTAGSSAAAPVAPRADDAIAAPTHELTECAKTDELPPNKPQQQSGFLHSPPDSNNNLKSDASESELSDLDEEPILSDAPAPALPSETGQDDIGEVLPDHWSGTVPVFKPTMHQFKDFKRFVRPSSADRRITILTLETADGSRR